MKNLYIGLMSGTSMDGIDAALVDVSTHTIHTALTYDYSPSTRAHLINVIEDQQTLIKRHDLLKDLMQLHIKIGRDFAAAAQYLLERSAVDAHEIIAIGSHGQTVAHDAEANIPYTIQLGCGHTIASTLGIPVVADFRSRDVLLGGKGAPFAPLYHHELFLKNPHATVDDVLVVNIGGIANVSFINDSSRIYGHDVGPGNGLMDSWIQKHLGEPYDQKGAWAEQGELIPELLTQMLTDPFFTKLPPKSLDKRYFSLPWLQAMIDAVPAAKRAKPEDVQATLLQLTATGIAREVQQRCERVIAICGGGAHNTRLIEVLRTQLPHKNVCSTQQLGIDPDFIEATMFAWFAYCHVNKIPLDMRTITGARKATILGAYYPS